MKWAASSVCVCVGRGGSFECECANVPK